MFEFAEKGCTSHAAPAAEAMKFVVFKVAGVQISVLKNIHALAVGHSSFKISFVPTSTLIHGRKLGRKFRVYTG